MSDDQEEGVSILDMFFVVAPLLQLQLQLDADDDDDVMAVVCVVGDHW